MIPLVAVIARSADLTHLVRDLVEQERKNVTCLIVLVAASEDLEPERARLEDLRRQIGVQADAIQVVLFDQARRQALSELIGNHA
jgi:hypothetical protein